MGDALGILIVAPVILVWSETPYHLPPRRQIYELAATFALFLVIAWLVFRYSLTGIGFSSLAYVIFPFQVWTAVRYSQRAVSTLTLFVALVALVGVMVQLEGASRIVIWDNLLSLWSYLVTLSITALLLCAALSERREIERTVGSLEERFSKAFHSAAVGISIVTYDDGRFVDVNQAYCAVCGYSRDELIGHTLTELNIRVDDPERVQMLEALHRNEPIYEVEQRVRTKSGDIRSGLLTVEPIWLAGKRHLLGMFQDITDRLQAEMALRASEARYRAVVEDQTEFIARIAPDWQIKFVNEAFCRYYGKTRTELIDSYFKPHVHADDFQVVRSALKSLGPKRSIVTYEHRVILPDGEERWQQWTDRVFLSDDGTIQEYQFVGKDITELKQMEQARVLAAVEHEKMQILADFIAAASHDFRTPLSVINTSAYLLNRITAVDQRERHFQTIQAQIRNVERLVDGLLMMSRLDRGDVFQLAPLDLNRLIRELETRKHAQFEQAGITLTLTLASELPQIIGDEDWLYRSIFRLMENAIQYTPAGGSVTVVTRVTANHVIVEIRDTGFGIEAKDLPHIFDRLYRGENHRPSGGQGLGLSIAKKIIDGHNGSIEVESTPGVGSSFRIRLPLTPADSSAETSPTLKARSDQSPPE